MNSHFKIAVIFLFLFLFLLLPATSIAQSITRGPYIQSLNDTSFILRWRTDIATDTGVRYSINSTSLDLSVVDAALTTEHEILLSSLPAQSEVWYAVGTSSLDLLFDPERNHVQTAPVAGERVPMRAWFLGDGGLPGAGLDAVNSMLQQRWTAAPADLLVLLGDNAYVSGTDVEYDDGLFNPYSWLLQQVPLWSTHGNHDQQHDGDNNDYFDFFSFPSQGECGGVASSSEAWYSFDYANVHFISLDTFQGDLTPPSVMLDWLAADLNASHADWTIVFTHYPPYSKGSHDSDLDWAMTQFRDNFVPVLEQGGVDLLLSGHSHNYERSMLINGHTGLSSTFSAVNIVDAGNGRLEEDGAYRKAELGADANSGTVYMVAGSSSRIGGGSLDHPVMIKSTATLGAVSVEVDGDRLVTRFFSSSGYELDAFTIVKGTPVSAPPLSSSFLLRSRPLADLRGVVFEIDLPQASLLNAAVYDLAGRKIRSLGQRHLPAGQHEWQWNGRDDKNRATARGVYFLQITGSISQRNLKFSLIK